MNSQSIRKSLQFLIFLTWTLGVVTSAKENFPFPAELEHDVEFWLRVYTEVDTKSGFIHDARNLAAVYETIKLGNNSHKNRRHIRAAKAKYAKILRKLGRGKRTGLTAEEQRVLALWGEGVSNRRLKRAAADLRFQLGQSDRFLEGLVRSGEWLPHIRKTLAERGLPPELEALPHVESSFNPEAYSSVGAAGIWQFTRSTGRRFLRIDYVVDERMDPYKASVAAAQLLEHNYNVTGSWPLALTAYNHGVAGMRRAARKLGSKDIATLVRKYKGRTFGFASRNFYVAFLAALKVSRDPARYFPPFQSAQPVDYEIVKVPDYISMNAFAEAFKLRPSTLKHHNRSLMAPIWSGDKRIPKGFNIRIPRDKLPQATGELIAAIPASERFKEQTPDLFHKVARGDTISQIATRYGYSIRQIMALNGLNNSHYIRAGQVLRLPAAGTDVARATPRPAATKIAAAKAVVTEETPPVRVEAAVLSVEEDVGTNEPDVEADLKQATQAGLEVAMELQASDGASPISLADPSDYAISEDNTIEIQASETLGHYAEWLGLRASQLRRINGLRYGQPVVIGQRLKLDFSRVNPKAFLQHRIAYQKSLQEAFFSSYQISSTSTHVVLPGESLWELSQRNYKVPVWLLRQYNPDLDINNVRPGTVIVIPELVKT